MSRTVKNVKEELSKAVGNVVRQFKGKKREKEREREREREREGGRNWELISRYRRPVPN